MEIQRKTVINAPAEHVWTLLGPGFADIAHWFSGVLRSDAVPAQAESGSSMGPVAGRVCLTPQGELTETITEYDETARRFAFVIEHGLPGFVVLAGNTFEVTDLGDGRSELSFRVQIVLKPVASVLMGWMFKRKVNETADQIVADFKTYAETGEVSERKRKSAERHAKRRAA